MRWLLNDGLVHDVEKLGATSRAWCETYAPWQPRLAVTRRHVTCIVCIVYRALWGKRKRRLRDKHA